MEPRITFKDAPKEVYPLMQSIEAYLKKSGIDHHLLELIKVRASQINGCGFCLDMHHKDAINAGETFQRLYLLPAWKESPVYSPQEKAVLNLTETLTKLSNKDHEEVDSAYELVAKYYSKEEIANLILAINQINSWNRFAITFGNIPGSYQPDMFKQNGKIESVPA
jgi:AhpD family alkylhydroperoxidase